MPAAPGRNGRDSMHKCPGGLRAQIVHAALVESRCGKNHPPGQIALGDEDRAHTLPKPSQDWYSHPTHTNTDQKPLERAQRAESARLATRIDPESLAHSDMSLAVPPSWAPASHAPTRGQTPAS